MVELIFACRYQYAHLSDKFMPQKLKMISPIKMSHFDRNSDRYFGQEILERKIGEGVHQLKETRLFICSYDPNIQGFK